MADLQAELLIKTGRYEEASKYAVEGIQLARIEGNDERLCDLRTVLGTSYMYSSRWNLAEKCFKESLKLKDKIKGEYLLIKAYKQMGELYLILGKIELSEEYCGKRFAWEKRTMMHLGIVRQLSH
ncbi:hypothetical protein ACFO25_13035 [Paenactinomyces guangxiensis]|uniref:Tetratricopeptide repeat protein n=1 Tax=Paenactinomyces guangxiensis TaxID=1490290 RepID=A0A7W1WNW7_9BACL|nr:tetratricopeptide repeat protein [Paenactinomyces guangxiensis]MBA4493373.1 tetratricopeptide repeat protein [Paenactinomyces guangxiensis]MBH8590463.1 tetratricopeptide repeat protein [Paenactinomyces guangxiensis]